jgi:FlaA1/EpsC-like NDP-sugar epimerase
VAVVEVLLRHRLIFLLVFHAAAFAAIYLLCYFVRFDGAVPPRDRAIAWTSLGLVVVLKLAGLLARGSHRGMWRYATFTDIMTLAESATLSTVAIGTVAFLGRGTLLSIPRSIVVMDWFGTLVILGGIRASIRLFREWCFPMISTQQARRVLIVGASETGEAVLRAIRRQPVLGMRVVGILDTDPRTHGWSVSGVKVVGAPSELKRHAARLDAEMVLVPSSVVSSEQLVELVTLGNELNLKVQVVPTMRALLSGSMDIRPRDVDIDDLLCREPVKLDTEAIGESLRGKVVMVTGAAGSIGSEICRQLLPFGIEQLVLLDHWENGLFDIERELRERAGTTQLVPCVASITDASRLRCVFAEYQPEVVFHAAAHKHVPMMEANPGEAVKNNVFGTRTLVDEAVDAGVEAFVMISTDKAVNPTSVMGACKRIAEMYVKAMSECATTRLVTVRFGNVLGSNGSVVPVFKEQIRKGGPVTVTHEDMTRYFMTIPEAAQLVLQAGTLGQGGEIFVLDMGEPVRIVDLARDLIRLSGLKEDRDIRIVFTGLRPGEKLHEELYDDEEVGLPTPHPKITLAQHRPCDLDVVRDGLARLAREVDGPPEDVIVAIEDLVPEYQPMRLRSGERRAGRGEPRAVAAV